jgi:RNA polymerase sigma factor for flagellar operon FliA
MSHKQRTASASLSSKAIQKIIKQQSAIVNEKLSKLESQTTRRERKSWTSQTGTASESSITATVSSQALPPPKPKALLANCVSGKIIQFDTEEECELWTDYILERDKTSPNLSNQKLKHCLDRLYAFYEWFAKQEASKFARKVPHGAIVQPEDCEAAAMAGLFEAIRAYDPRTGVKPEVFARWRIRGEMLDQLRQLQHYPRSIATARRELKPVIAILYQKLQKKPTIEEIHDYIISTVTDKEKQVQCTNWLKDSLFHTDVFNQSASRISASNDPDGDGGEHFLDPYESVPDYRGVTTDLSRRMYFIELVQNVLASERMKTIVYGYYFMRMTHRSIAYALGLSPSSVVVERQKAVELLRYKLRERKKELREELK